MKNKLFILLYIIICIFLVGCKKETPVKTSEIDLSKYELNDYSNVEYEYAIDNNANFSYAISSPKEVSNYITLEFTIGREFYGYPEIVGTIYDFIEAGYADAKISATKAKENRTFITLSPENPLITDLGLVSSIKEITASEAKELSSSKRIFHFTELIFPTNIITKTQYNFSLINYELYDEKEKPYQEETNIEYNKIILTLSQYYVYEMLDEANPGYVPELAGNYVVNLDGQPGFLIRSKYVYTQYHGEKIYLKYEKNYINYDYREIDKPYPLCDIIKKYAKKTNYWNFYTPEKMMVGDVEWAIKVETYYDCILYEDYLNILEEYDALFSNFYNEISEEEFEQVIIDNREYSSLLFSDIDNINKKIEKGNSLYKVEFSNDGYFLVKYEYEEYGHEVDKKYYKFDSIDDCDLFHITKVYYVRDGVITKDLMSDKEYNVNVRYVVDVTKLNTNGYSIPLNRLYVKGLTYSYDGLIVISNDDLSKANDKPLVLGKDMQYISIYDLKKDNGNDLVILKEVERNQGAILNVYSEAKYIEELIVYPIEYLDDLFTTKTTTSYIYSVNLNNVIERIK